MTLDDALAALRLHRARLYDMGIQHAAIFGSTARGEGNDASDLDLVVTLRRDIHLGWDYFTLEERVGALLGIAVDLISDPARRPRLQAEINRAHVDAF